MKKPDGFTLVELLITVSIAAILLGIAIPSFIDFIARNRSDAQVSAVINSLNYARSEAVRRSAPVSITPLDGANWSSGWRVWADLNNDNVYADGTDAELHVTPPLTGAVSIVAGGLTFDALGTTAGATLAYCREGYADLDRQIVIEPLGRVRSTRSPCP